jgi:tetratricopeptide (TPR) repeat protein
VAFAVMLGFGCRPQTPPRPAAGAVIVVGLDAADWRAIDPLIEAGKLPTFARLRGSAATGTLIATPPLVSPILWTTIATGRPPEEHGVLDFMVDLPSGGQAPVGTAQRRVPALWNLFSAAGRTVAVVGWWATWPAERVAGTMVSDAVAPQLTRAGPLDAGLIFPASAAARIAPDIVRPQQVSFEELAGWVPLTREEYQRALSAASGPGGRLYEDPLAHLAAVVAATRTYGAIAEDLLRRDRPDLLAVYVEATDTVSHLFVRDPRRGPPALERAYREADALIGRLAGAASPDTLIVVCSDHGFHPPTAAVAEDPSDLTGPATAWHRPYGIVAGATAGALSGRAVSTRQDLGLASPLDIAPTVLHAAGLPVKTEMPGHVLTALLPPEARSRAVRAEKTTETVAPPAAAAAADAEAIRARLQALGYVGAGATSSLARQNLGEVLYRRGRLDTAEREFRAVVEAQPQNLAAQLWLAKVLRERGRTREALAAYERAFGLPGDRGEAVLEAVELAAAEGQRDEARRLLAAAARTSAPRAPIEVARAVVEQAEGRPREAERALRAALSVDPLSFAALSRLFDVAVASRRLGETLPLLTAAARRAPGSAQHQALLGEALLAAGRPADAAAAFEAALALAPDSAAVRLDLARAQIGQRQLEAARATLGPVPPSADRSLLLGAIASMQDRWAEAAEHYRAALGAGPATPELLNGLAWAQLKLGKGQEAAGLFGRSLGLRPDQPEIRRLLAGLAQPAPARP